MSETFEDRFHCAMANFLAANGVKDVFKVIEVNQEKEADSSCGYNTCWYEGATTVEITYETTTGHYGNYTYSGDFGALIRELT